MNWRKAWWNVEYHKRANLKKLPDKLRLANDPWFVLKREHVICITKYINLKTDIVKTICDGGLANESLFAIILYIYNQLNSSHNEVIASVTHATDWSRMESSTSPHLFKNADELDIKFIDNEIQKNKYIIFIRKISPEFPDDILNHYIYVENKKNDDTLIINEPNKIINLYIKATYIYIICVITYFIIYAISFLHLLTFPSITAINTIYKSSHRFIC
jgi:hypothetical protein